MDDRKIVIEKLERIVSEVKANYTLTGFGKFLIESGIYGEKSSPSRFAIDARKVLGGRVKRFPSQAMYERMRKVVEIYDRFKESQKV